MLFVTAMVFLTTVAASFGQEENDSSQTDERRWSLGITGGAQYNMFTSDAGIKPLGETNCLCPNYTYQPDVGYVLGIVLGWSFTERTPWSLTSALQVSYIAGVAAMYAPDESLVLADENGESIGRIVTSYEGTTRYSSLEVAPSVAMFIADSPIAISVGVGVSRILSTSFHSTGRLVEPQNASFDPSIFPGAKISGDGRTVTYYDGEMAGAASWMVTAMTGIEAHFNSNDGQLIPAFRYRYGITDLSTTSGTRVSALELSLSLRVFL